MSSKKAKKKAAADHQSPSAVSSEPLLPPSGRRLIAAGCAVVFCGFVALSFTDPLGRNWASHLSSFLIVAGYVLVALGLFQPDAPPEKTT